MIDKFSWWISFQKDDWFLFIDAKFIDILKQYCDCEMNGIDYNGEKCYLEEGLMIDEDIVVCWDGVWKMTVDWISYCLEGCDVIVVCMDE